MENKAILNSILPGTVVKIEKDAILISTGDRGIIKILGVIPSGTKEMSARDFINGYKIRVGDRLV